LTTVEEEEHGG